MFLQHLLDGDPASNSLGWQWIASTYSHKPYLFDQGNVQRFSDHCSRCSAARNGSCPFREYIDIPPAREFSKPLPMAQKSQSVAIVDVTTLFDPINPTFLGFDPQNTWPCSNAESITVDYDNGHGGHDARIPITDFGMT